MIIEFNIIGGWDYLFLSPIYKEFQKRGHEVTYLLPPKEDIASCFSQRFHNNHKEYGLTKWSHERNFNADIFITLQGPDKRYKNKQIKIQYGINFLYQTYFICSKTNTQGLDGILAYGQYSKDLTSKWIESERIKIVHPLIYMDPAKDPNETKKELKITNNEKKTIVYLTTWDEHCCIDTFFAPLKELSENYNLVIRPHGTLFTTATDQPLVKTNPDTGKTYVLDQKDRIKKLYELTPHLNDADPEKQSMTTLKDIAQVADLVIADAKSGALAEMILCNDNVPIIAITPMDDKEKEERFYPEIYELCPLLNKTQELVSTAESLLKQDAYRENRKRMKPYLFSPNTENIPQQAADAILELASMPKLSETEKPIKRFKRYVRSKLGITKK